jgi:pilus assembly protein Flp/PilA
LKQRPPFCCTFNWTDCLAGWLELPEESTVLEPLSLSKLRADRKGVVSFEYVIVAAAIVTAVAAAFTTDAANAITNALTAAMGVVAAAVTTAVGG